MALNGRASWFRRAPRTEPKAGLGLHAASGLRGGFGRVCPHWEAGHPRVKVMEDNGVLRDRMLGGPGLGASRGGSLVGPDPAGWTRRATERPFGGESPGRGAQGSKDAGRHRAVCSQKAASGVGGAGAMKDGGGLRKRVCQQWAGPANTQSCQAGRRLQGARRKGQSAGGAINLWQDIHHPPNPISSSRPWGEAGYLGVPLSFFSVPLPSPFPRERPSSGPQGSRHPVERGLHATVHFGESLAEIIS